VRGNAGLDMAREICHYFTMMTMYRNFIGGRWIECANGERFQDINPADNEEIIGEFQRSIREDVVNALETAKEAQKEWADTSPIKRGQILHGAAQLMERRSENLAKLLTREEGKTLVESRNEVNKAVNIFKFFAEQGRRLNGEVIPSEKKDTFLYTLKIPLGVVSIITPWNDPIAIPAWKIAPALISGNSVVFKPASLTPLLGLRLTGILDEAGLPKGILNYVIGSGSIVGDEMVTNRLVDAVSFTGSYEVGHLIYRKAALNMTGTQLELGRKNVLIILEDADIDRAVELAVKGAFGETGQCCTATSRVIVIKKVVSKFTERLIERMRHLKIGNGLDENIEMGPVVSESELAKDLEYINIGKKEGGELILGGSILEGGEYDKGFFIKPAAFTEVDPEMRIAREEIFGPVLTVIKAGNFEEALSIANNVEYGLSASTCTNDLGKVHEFVRSIEAEG